MSVNTIAWYSPVLVHAVHCAEKQVVQCNSAVLTTNSDIILSRSIGHT